VLAGETDDFGKKIQIGDIGRRVRGITQHHGDRFGDGVQHRPVQFAKETLPRFRRQVSDSPPGHQEAEGMNRITRVRTQDHIAGRSDRLGHVGESLLGPERGDDLRVRIEIDPETPLVIGCLGPPQSGDAP